MREKSKLTQERLKQGEKKHKNNYLNEWKVNIVIMKNNKIVIMSRAERNIDYASKIVHRHKPI